MQYQKPILHALDLTIAVAACTPAPRSHEECKADSRHDLVIDPTNSKGEGVISGGIYVGQVNGVDTCLLAPQDDPNTNVNETLQWLCLVTGGAVCL